MMDHIKTYLYPLKLPMWEIMLKIYYYYYYYYYVLLALLWECLVEEFE